MGGGSLTAVLVEDVGEAVQDAVAAATVGATPPDPLAVRDQAAAPASGGVKEDR